MTNQCRFDGCDRPVRVAKAGLCHAHYMQTLRGDGQLRPLRAKTPAGAVCLDCGELARVKGRCRTHYKQEAARVANARRRAAAGPPASCAGPGCGRVAGRASGLCVAHRRQLARRGGDAARLTPLGAPEHVATPRPAKPKPTPKPAPRAAKTMPAGWDTPAPTRKPRTTQKTRETGPEAIYLLDLNPPTPTQEAAVLALLARHHALDLADMLGIAS